MASTAEQPPLGNTPFEVAMAELGDGVCLIGGSSHRARERRPAQVREHVLDLFGRVLPRNLLLCTSDATAGTPVENLRAADLLVDT